MAIVQSDNGLITVNQNYSVTPATNSLSLFTNNNRTSYSDLYKHQPEVRTVIDFLARNVSQIPLHAFEHLDNGDRNRLRDIPLTETIERPDLYLTRSRFFEAMVKDLCIFDEVFYIKVKGSNGRINLVRIPPIHVEILGKNWLMPDGYRIKGNNGYIDYTREEVIHIHGYNPIDLRKGLSPLETLRQLLAEQIAAGEHRELLWKQGARTALVIERPATAPSWSETARARFKEDWDTTFTGTQGAGSTAVLEEGMTAKPLNSFSPKDAMFIEASVLAREVVCAAYGVPTGLLGLGNVNYSSLTEQHRMLYQDTLLPYLTIIQEELEAQLLPDFGLGSEVYLEFQLQDKLKGSFEETASVLSSAVGAPWLTRNEARARQNLSAVEGGDELVTPLNVLSGGQPSPQTPLNDNTQASSPNGMSHGLELLVAKTISDMLDTKYSPDQPRDERGRFGSSDGSSNSTNNEINKLGLGAGGKVQRAGMGDIKLVDKTVSVLKESPYTSKHITADGKFTPERQKLHDDIVNKLVSNIPPSSDPTFHMLGGGPGVGKSTYERSEYSTLPKNGEAVKINPDEIKNLLPEVQEAKNAGDTSWAPKSHEESSYIAQRVRAAAFETGRDVVLDGTGNSSVENVANKINEAREAGYKIEGHYITRSIEDSLASAEKRASDPNSDSYGRKPPSEVIIQTHKNISSNFEQIAPLFDNVKLFDVSEKGAPPVLVAFGTKDNTINIIDDGKYQSFKDKVNYNG